LILLAGAFTTLSWIASWVIPTAGNVGTLVIVLWVLCLIWLAVFLEDFGLPLAASIAGLIGWLYTNFEVNIEAHMPIIIAGACLIGGSIGAIIGGVLRKINKSSHSISLIFTLVGSLAGFLLGYAAILIFSWLMWA
jgi:hypothetical protein